MCSVCGRVHSPGLCIQQPPVQRTDESAMGERRPGIATLRAALVIDPGVRIAQWFWRYRHQALKGAVHLQDQKDRARHGERADTQRDHDGRVARREHPKAYEDHSEPEDQHDQKRHRDGLADTADARPAGVQQRLAKRHRMRLEPALVLRGYPEIKLGKKVNLLES